MSKSRRRSVLWQWSRRDLLKGVGLGGLAAAGNWLLSACTAPGPASPSTSATSTSPSSTLASSKAVKGGTLVEAPPFEGLNVSPLMANALGVTSMLFDGLLVVQFDGTLGPLLAQAPPKVSADGRTYTFDLRKDARWSDGTMLTADDVVFTYKVLSHPDYQSFPSPYRANLQAILADVQGTDPFTVVMTTRAVSASFAALHSAYGVLPKHILGDVPPDSLKDHAFNRAPTVASGPFKFKEWIAGDHMTVERNDSCYRGAPYLDQYVLKFFAQQTGIVTGLKTGEVDATFLTQESVFEELKAAPNLNLNIFINGVTCPRPAYNLDPAEPVSKIFSSKAVRQPLLYAADRESAAKSTLFGYTVRPSSTGVFLPGNWAENPSAKPDYAYDKQKAEQLLDADGWQKGPTGIREKDGVPLRFELLTSANNNVWVQQSTIFQQNWKDIGVDVTLRPQQFAQVITTTLAREFQMVMSQVPYASTPADPDRSSAFHSRNAVKNVDQNYSGYKNPQLDDLLDQAVATFDQAKRKELYYKVQDILNEDVPIWSTWYWQVAWATNKRVASAGPERSGPYTFQSRAFANEWYVTNGK